MCGSGRRTNLSPKTNALPKGFLPKHRRGPRKNGVVYLPLSSGFLKLEYGLYDNPGILSLVSFVLDDFDEALAVGSRLEMSLSEDGQGDEVTYISENGVSGLQWSNGEVIWGHTYDDDSPPSPGKKIPLEEWIDEMIDAMVNPPQEEIDERRKFDAEDEEYQDLLKKRKRPSP